MDNWENDKYNPKNLVVTVSFTGEQSYKCNLQQLIEDIKRHEQDGFFNDKNNGIYVKLDTK